MKDAKIIYRLREGDVPSYSLEVLKRGCCAALLPGSWFLDERGITVICDASGAKPLSEMACTSEARFLSGFRAVLSALVKLCEAVVTAEDWLIDTDYLSYRPEDVFFDADSGEARLLLKPSSKCFADAAAEFCEFAASACPSANAGLIKERLEKENEKGRLSPVRLLRILTVWDFEWRDL